ncbi:hypothetical protein DICVIV_03064 [Dictyocaulus viviparus]|uniref:Protein kinase domain-containing protein n=1 Tax=Dictyocaulus viviparus TaxID=29172 RepID=A0A0D8Y493_DICVI|nr:hypothetical protein DICVIV_03064 [Dictyocaulus viviparus]
MATPLGTGGAVVEEVPSNKKQVTNKDAEVKQQQELAREFAKQNGLVDETPKTASKARKADHKKKIRRPRRDKPREKLKVGETVTSDLYTWKVVKILGSGGFGDVYKVVKVNNFDKKEYAMKTEMVEGDKLKLRLKIEVLVLSQCSEITNPEKKKHFVPFIDRGKTDRFKFLVMGLVGKSLEDIRRTILLRNYSKSTAMNVSQQTLQAIWDLHNIGYLHRDIKPANFAIGLGEFEKTIYILDFGIARKYCMKDTKEVKVARISVKFLGTLRFASRACHLGVDQGRKDDLETWLYMLFDVFDSDSLPWKRVEKKNQIVSMKQKFIKAQYPSSFKIVPAEVGRLMEYIDRLGYADEPDYVFIQVSLKTIARENKIDVDKQLDWIGKSAKQHREEESSSSTSSDNRNTGSDDSEEEDRKSRRRPQKNSGSKFSGKMTMPRSGGKKR